MYESVTQCHPTNIDFKWQAYISPLISAFPLVDFSASSVSSHPSEEKKTTVLLDTRDSCYKNDFDTTVVPVPRLHIGIKETSSDSKGRNTFLINQDGMKPH